MLVQQRGKALVAGGSLGGLLAANLLLRDGWDVHVFERASEELEGRGAGLVTHPELLDALALAGAVVDESIGVRVARRITLDRAGAVVATRELPQTFTAWSRLFNTLMAAFPPERYHNGCHLAGFEEDADAVTAVFADGVRVRGALLVAADGIRSVIRQTLLPDARPQYAGYVAWRGLVEESALSAHALRDLFPYFSFGLPPQEQMVAYPVAGQNNTVEPGKRRFNFVWYRPADEETTLRELQTDADGKIWDDGIPPPLIRPAVLGQARQAAREVLAPLFAEVVAKTENLFFQPILDLAVPHMAFGRVALLGDSAFVARPHCGMGVTKAAGDALELVRALRETADVPLALKNYETPRIAFGDRVLDVARSLGAYMQAQLHNEREREMAARYRTPEAVMRDTAVPLAD